VALMHHHDWCWSRYAGKLATETLGHCGQWEWQPRLVNEQAVILLGHHDRQGRCLCLVGEQATAPSDHLSQWEQRPGFMWKKTVMPLGYHGCQKQCTCLSGEHVTA
jgi:hypothetical protein